MEKRRANALHTHRVVCVFAAILAVVTVATAFSGVPELVLTAASVLFGFLMAVYGQRKTLLELKRLRPSDCPLRFRFFGFAKWYETAPDRYDPTEDDDFAAPPRPTGQV